MKKIFLLLLLTSLTFAQVDSTFYGLRGYEDLDGNTHLFFDIGSSIKYDNEWGNYDSKSSITHYNIHNNIDSSFLSSYSFDFEPISRGFDVVTDFELWSISPINFIKCGTSGVTTSKAYLEINHRPIIFPNFSSSTNNIEISNLNDSILYIDIEGSPSGIYKSIDGGYNWNYLDSTNEQSLISVSKNQLNVIFTTDKYGYLMKSIDDCKTFILADSNLDKKYNIDNLNRFFLYDSDSSHIYRVIENQNIFKLVVSDSVGELGTWREVFQSDRNIFISHNPSKSGEIYFANNKEIYKSENYGETYNLVLELENTISGIYKKSNSDLLYATTPHKLLEINSDSIKILKQLIDYEALSYYPMHVGDYWEYQVTMRGEGQYDNDDWVGYKRVIGDSVLSNNKKYFIVQSNRLGTQNNDAIETQLIKIDSSKGNVYQYDYDGQDILIDSLFMEVNDSVDHECKVFSNIYYKDVFGKKVKTRFYEYKCITFDNMQFNYELSQGFGEIHRNYSYAPVTNIDFQYSLVFTKINGIEYGIKTAVENNPKTLQTQFSLSQNYPNPFNPTTKIEYSVPSSEFVSLKIYDVLGREVATLINQSQKPGNYKTVWNAINFASGIYYYSLKTNNKIISKKMLLLK